MTARSIPSMVDASYSSAGKTRIGQRTARSSLRQRLPRG